MKLRGRHKRDYFEASIEVWPPALQAIAAVAITFALTFAGRRFVPDWIFVLTLVLGITTLVGASLWSWQARRLLLGRPVRDKRNSGTRTRPFSVNSRGWLIAALAGTEGYAKLSLKK
jgi:hypothetical protein